MGYVYKITNTVNGKCYIGISVNEPEKDRIQKHLSGKGNRIIASAVKKYGRDAFTYEVLEANVFDELLPDLEVAYIAKLNTIVPHGYNRTHGGDGSGSPSEQTRQRISASLKGRPLPAETRRKIGLAFKGKKRKPRPAKTRRKLSEALKGRKRPQRSEEHCRRLAEANRGKKFYVDSTGKRSLRRKASRDLERESGDVIDLAKSTYDAARDTGMNKGQASKHTAKIVNVSETTIFNWRKRFGWDG